MIEKCDKIKERVQEISALLCDTSILQDAKRAKQLGKELKNLEPIASLYDEYLKLEQNVLDAEELLKVETDETMKAYFQEEIYSGKDKKEKMEEELKILMLPKDENDDKNVIMEIRGGAGGEEAALFAAEILRMYMHYADIKHWNFEIIDINETELGGIKECTAMISGNGAYSRLKYESGVHRVQRVPETETQGRVHTSTITVAVLPEQEDVEIEVLEKDLRIDTYRASGAGGQHINKTDSAVRITHLPTGIVVACQDQRSQIKNKEKAMNILKSKLYDKYQTEADEKYAASRKSQVGTGDRSERIRTYNFPQGRVTDHRIGYTMYNIEAFMNGDIDDVVTALEMADQKAKLEAQVA
ncbi:MAG TPA: peptide chain release factor 1 [Clostridiales bacterium]|nr:peptide chain release factor 1 [Clostridiales bacterium]